MKKITLSILALLNSCHALDMNIQSSQIVKYGVTQDTYHSSTIPATAYVVKIPLGVADLALVPAIGQREGTCSIAKRTGATIAINGSNYRRGGNYNGNRVNLFYLNNQVYADLQFTRGAFGWNSKTRVAAIDTVFLEVDFSIAGVKLPVTAINQPRTPGQAVLYTDVADTALLAYTPGLTIVIDNNKRVVSASTELPAAIPAGWLVYQTDADLPYEALREVGAQVTCTFNVKSTEQEYNDYDFMLAGAGLLLQQGKIVSDNLYQEFSQGTEIVHCGDEVAADFHTRKMQEWLIELRHPRTAIGITAENELCVVVVDGRQKQSEGLSLKELAQFMQELGCVDALNIGGGGCSTLCINNELINIPSASAEKPVAGEERPVSEALCFFLK